MKQGLSGFNVRREGDLVIKSTSGEESIKKLKHDMHKQIDSIGKIHPIASVPVKKIDVKVVDGHPTFIAEMSYMGIDLGSCKLNSDQIELVKYRIKESLEGRIKGFSWGLNKKITDEVIRIKHFVREIYGQDEADRIIIEDYICKFDVYKCGYAHGDLGFRNLFLIGKTVYATDFTKSFIDCPLVDVVTLEASAESMGNDKKKIVDYVKLFISEPWHDQYEAIKKVKQLQWKYRA